MISIKKITELAHHKTGLIIKKGDYVVDATAGNGNDTVFLAEKVGPVGHVYAFDIQIDALAKTAEILKKKELSDRVSLIQSGHEQLLQYVRNPVSVVMYNLGFLPGGDRQVTTKSETTLSSFKQALTLLKPGGMITMVIYPGHSEGRLEKEELMLVCKDLSSSDYAVLHLELINQANDPPELFVVQKIFFRPAE